MQLQDLLVFLVTMLFMWALYFTAKPFMLRRIWHKTDYENFVEFYQYCVKKIKKGKIRPTYKFSFVLVTSFCIALILVLIALGLIYVYVLLGASEFHNILKFKF